MFYHILGNAAVLAGHDAHPAAVRTLEVAAADGRYLRFQQHDTPLAVYRNGRHHGRLAYHALVHA